MAEITTLVDDLDGSTDDVTAHVVALDGQAVRLDLGAKNLEKLITALQPYMDAGRSTQSTRTLSVAPREPKPAGAKRASNYPDEYENNKALYKEWLMEKYGEKTGKGRQKMEKTVEFAEAFKGGWSPKA